MNQQPFIDEDKIKGLMNLRQLFWRLWPYIRNYKKLVTVIIICVLSFTVIGRLMPFLFGYAIDHGIKLKQFGVVTQVAIAYFIFEFLRMVLNFSHTFLTEKLGNRVLYDLRETLIQHVQNLPTQFFDKNPTGRIVTRVTNDVLSLGDLFNQGFTAIIVCTLEMIAITIALIWLSPFLALLTLSIAPIAIYLSIHIANRARFYFGETKKKMAQQNSFTAESLNGMKVIQLFLQTEERKNRFASLSAEYKEAQIQTVRQFALLWPIVRFFNIATVALALLFCALFYQNLGLTIGQISTFLLLVQSFYQPTTTLLERYNQFQNSLAGADRIFGLLSEKVEDSTGVSKELNEIEYKQLTFRYSEIHRDVLKNVSFKIQPGQSLALVGRTGSGKSTLISLLQKLYTYENGEILIDGVSLKKISTQSLRGQLGIVQQDPYIFRGTLLTNITLHNDSISETQAREALIKVGGHHLLNRTGLEIHTPIEERGSNLSVGEKQILSFARVLAHNPRVLVLDEATANIDSESEKIIQQATQEVMKNRTCIVIAHRLSTIANCDQILVLKDGEIVERGRHLELMNQGGLYASYHQS